MLPAGAGADGYKALSFNGVGEDFPFYDDLREYVIDAGKSAGDGSTVGTVQYNRGILAAMLAAESARTAQEIHGTPDITPEMMRDGMEALTLDDARLAEIGMTGFAPELAVKCANHRGEGYGAVTQWNAAEQEWVQISDFIAPDADVIWPLVEEDAAAFRAESGAEQRECPAG